MRDPITGSWIRGLRQRLELSQVELAALLGVSNVTVNRWENDRALPQSGMVDRLLRLERDGVDALLGPPAARIGNLPLTFTSLVGRAAELETVVDQVATSPLVTISGPAGAGKTRLAIETGRSTVSRWPDGLWFVDLAAVNEPDAVLHAVARTLGVREAGRKPLIDRVADAFRERKLLLILDNCEHLLPACATLAVHLVAQESAARLMATSRVPLTIPGETVYSIKPLAIADAAALFIDRAGAHVSAIDLDTETTETIASICRRLDGLPLAIELAAARARVLSLAQIADRIDQRFELLKGANAVSPRQQALETAIAWSCDLLTRPEAALFRQLGVFAGSFDLAAVEAITDGDDALDILDSLARQSMIVVEHDASSRSARYRLLESMAAYARRWLEETGETAATRRRHAEYYGALARNLAGGLRGAAQAALLSAFDREHDNLIAALDWLLTAGETEAAIAMVAPLGAYWRTRGYYAEGIARLERTLACAPVMASSSRTDALNQLAQLQIVTGHHDEAAQSLTAAIAFAQDLGDRSQEAQALDSLGLVLVARREFEEAVEAHHKALTMFTQQGDRARAAMCRKRLGNLANLRGDHRAAERAYHDAWSLVQGTGDITAEGAILSNMGDLAARTGNYERALGYLERALARLRTLGDPDRIAVDAVNTAEVKIVLGESEAALPLVSEAVAQFRAIGNTSSLASALYIQSAAHAALGQRLAALTLMRESLALFHGLDDWIDVVYAAEAIARLLAEGGETVLAARLLGGVDVIRQREQVADYPLFDSAGTLAMIRSALGDDLLASSWKEGSQLSASALIAEATMVGSIADGDPVYFLKRQSPRATSFPHRAPLTDRQIDILRLAADGLSNREIGRVLAISDRTVERHLTAIFSALDVDRRSAAIAKAVASGLLSQRDL